MGGNSKKKGGNSKKKGEIPKIKSKKLEFVEFSLICPVSTRLTNCFATSLWKFCARRKHRIKILKAVRHRHRNDLGRTVFRFPIYSTGPE